MVPVGLGDPYDPHTAFSPAICILNATCNPTSRTHDTTPLLSQRKAAGTRPVVPVTGSRLPAVEQDDPLFGSSFRIREVFRRRTEVRENVMQPIIEVEGIRKAYGETVAIADVSFSVQPGEIFGIIGPNGAGKTTTVESIIGLRKPDRGRISVLGLDPVRERAALAQRIGVQLQAAALAERMKVWEALDLFSSLYTHTVPYEPLLE